MSFVVKPAAKIVSALSFEKEISSIKAPLPICSKTCVFQLESFHFYFTSTDFIKGRIEASI